MGIVPTNQPTTEESTMATRALTLDSSDVARMRGVIRELEGASARLRTLADREGDPERKSAIMVSRKSCNRAVVTLGQLLNPPVTAHGTMPKSPAPVQEVPAPGLDDPDAGTPDSGVDE